MKQLKQEINEMKKKKKFEKYQVKFCLSRLRGLSGSSLRGRIILWTQQAHQSLHSQMVYKQVPFDISAKQTQEAEERFWAKLKTTPLKDL